MDISGEATLKVTGVRFAKLPYAPPRAPRLPRGAGRGGRLCFSFMSWENWLVTSSSRVIACCGEFMIKLSQISNLKVFELKFLIIQNR